MALSNVAHLAFKYLSKTFTNFIHRLTQKLPHFECLNIYVVNEPVL